jgi:CRP-like cAMP-binding protein
MASRDLLLRSPLFQRMPALVVDALVARATRLRLRKKQRAGSRSVLVLVTGRLDVIVDGNVVRSLAPPAVVGMSVAAGAEPSASLVAAEDSELVTIPQDAFVAVLKRYPDAALVTIAHFGTLIGELSAEVEMLRQHGLVHRVRHRLTVLAAARREVAITHAQLAAEVGGTRANVSRALARLEAEGSLTRRRGRILLG